VGDTRTNKWLVTGGQAERTGGGWRQLTLKHAQFGLQAETRLHEVA